ncbi:hypothetical protein KCV03_g398, partial [Aureobasidium melanogenum]
MTCTHSSSSSSTCLLSQASASSSNSSSRSASIIPKLSLDDLSDMFGMYVRKVSESISTRCAFEVCVGVPAGDVRSDPAIPGIGNAEGKMLFNVQSERLPSRIPGGHCVLIVGLSLDPQGLSEGLVLRASVVVYPAYTPRRAHPMILPLWQLPKISLLSVRSRCSSLIESRSITRSSSASSALSDSG